MQFVHLEQDISSFTIRIKLVLTVTIGYGVTLMALYPFMGIISMVIAVLPVIFILGLWKAEWIKHRRVEAALRESEERYKSVVQTVESAIFCLSVDHRILEWNSQAEKLYGWTRDEVLGKDYFELFLPPSVWDAVAADIRKVLKGEPTRGFENEVLTRNGGRHVMQWNVTRLLDAHGLPGGVVACGFDITERKQMEMVLRQSEERYRSLYHDSPIMLFTLDADSIILSVNDFGAKQLGYTTAELKGQSVLSVFDEADQTAVLKQFQICVQHPGQMYRWQFRKVRKDGSQLWVEEFARAVSDLSGKLSVLIVCQDITESKQAEDQRLELARTRERAEVLRAFLRSISHDLTTPLTVIITNLYLLEKTSNPQQQHHRIETIRSQTLHLEKLIQEILSISRLEETRELAIRSVHVEQLIQNIQNHFSSLLKQKGVTLQLDVSANLPTVLAHESELADALIKLMENAVQFTAEAGVITLRAYPRNDQVVIEVQDSGTGISEADLPQIFDPFFRADQARSANTGGTGLGLSIVKRIVELHQGQIEAESVVGQGSLLRIRLPVMQDAVVTISNMLTP